MQTSKSVRLEIEGQSASSTSSRMSLFDDPRWDERFDILIRYTQRTELIQQLTGIQWHSQKLKAEMNKRLEAMGVSIRRPRGGGTSTKAKTVLSHVPGRYDAAYLIGLHFGANGPGTKATFEATLGGALDRRLEAYSRYRNDLYGNDSEPRIKFAEYIALIDAIKSGYVSVHHCHECYAVYPWSSELMGHHSCPLCAHHRLDVRAHKRDIQKLLDKRRNSELIKPLKCAKA